MGFQEKFEVFEAKLAAVIDLLKSGKLWSPDHGLALSLVDQLGLDELWQSLTELKNESHDKMKRRDRGREQHVTQKSSITESRTQGNKAVGVDDHPSSATSRGMAAQRMEVADPELCGMKDQPFPMDIAHGITHAAAHHRTTSGATTVTGMPTSPHLAPPSLTLSTAQMGDLMVGNVGAYIECPGFSGKISLSGLERTDLGAVSRMVKDPIKHGINHSHLGVRLCSDRKTGASKLFSSVDAPFRFPYFSEHPAEASCNYLNNTISSPPLTPLTYYVGSPLAPASFNDLLHPGHLLTLGNIPGVNTIYWHAGEAGSDVIFTPERLKKEGIAFDVIRAGPGDLVCTAPGQYHAVLNSTICFAIAINFVLPGEPVLNPTTACRKCGLFNLQNVLIKHPDKRKAPTPGHRKPIELPTARASSNHTSHNRPQKRQKPACKSVHASVKRNPRRAGGAILASENISDTTDLDWQPMENASAAEWQDYIVSHDPFCKTFGVTVTDTLVLRILLAVCGRSGIKALVDVVHCWRNQELTEIDLLRNMRGSGQYKDIAGFLTQLSVRGSLRQILELYAKVEFSKIVSKAFGDQGRLHVSDWVKVHNQMGLVGKPDESAQRSYRAWRKDGRRLSQLPYGLLCLLPSEPAYPSLIKLADLVVLDEVSAASLRCLLESDPYSRHLLDVGQKLMDAIWDGRDIPECKWEGATSASICESEPEQALDRIALFDLAECTYDPVKFVNTPAPDGWHREWPINPMIGDGCWECTKGKAFTCKALSGRSRSGGTTYLGRDPSAYLEGRLISGIYRILARATRDLISGDEVTTGLSDSSIMYIQKGDNISNLPDVGRARTAKKKVAIELLPSSKYGDSGNHGARVDARTKLGAG
ncbi:lysine -specific demethylase 4c-like protein [Diaporthe amygdali]|uniref:lysine -specific demethylase 4c-like protein n=1 Tax=Phomopsis amygdali TaxID=1214568 RepID=UPI0022FEB6E9|nr:lysine -specific demethylase 4c-like protein [Diaporthe amygdali]KAJ0123537.1 lysine -specific demethylase 4c-like protein [Diaporthe amygdali]